VITGISFAYFGGKRKEEKDNAEALRTQRFAEKRKELTQRARRREPKRAV
jgi:hypothetical protein